MKKSIERKIARPNKKGMPSTWMLAGKKQSFSWHHTEVHTMPMDWCLLFANSLWLHAASQMLVNFVFTVSFHFSFLLSLSLPFGFSLPRFYSQSVSEHSLLVYSFYLVSFVLLFGKFRCFFFVWCRISELIVCVVCVFFFFLVPYYYPIALYWLHWSQQTELTKEALNIRIHNEFTYKHN